MKTHKFILLNLFIFSLSIIACATTISSTHRGSRLADQPRRPAAVQAGSMMGLFHGQVQAAFAFTPETFPVKFNNEAALQDSVIQITVVPSDPAEKTVSGIGTLVAYQDQVFIFTHNHWDSIEHWDRVYFRDAKGEPILELNGRDIDALVVYQDRGTLVLRSPLPKNRPAAPLGERGTVKPGDTVTLPYHNGKNDSIDLQTGYVTKLSKRNGIPIFKITLLNGDPVGPCDCGGGVWHDGGFIGTVWQVQLDDHWSLKRLVPLRSIQELNVAQALLEMVERQHL